MVTTLMSAGVNRWYRVAALAAASGGRDGSGVELGRLAPRGGWLG